MASLIDRSVRFSDAGVALVLAACAAASAEDAATRVLLDERLGERVVELSGLDGSNLLIEDRRGQVMAMAREGQLALVAPVGVEPSDRWGASVLRLVDGQRLVGTLVGGETQGDEASVWWDHGAFGMLRVPLEDIDHMTLAPGAGEVPSDVRQDVVILANGDRIEGFVERIGEPVVVDDAGERREVPLAAVGAIVLANPHRAMEGAYVWLADGSVLSLSDIGTAREGRVVLSPSLAGGPEGTIAEGGSGELPIGAVLALVFDARRLEGLGELEPGGVAIAPDRRWSEPVGVGDASTALLGAPTVEIPGPMAVWWTLPEGAARLSLVAELPPSMRRWGDCELVVEVGREGAWRQVARERLNAERPEVGVNVPLDGPVLRITVEEGRYGPVQDRVMLRRGLLLIEPE